MKKLSKQTFKYIEQAIYDHQKTKKAFDDLTNDIIHSSPEQHEIRSTDTSDPTYAAASLLATCKIRERMKDKIYAIDMIFINTDPKRRIVLEQKYWEKPYLEWSTVAENNYIDKRTLYNWRVRLVQDIAIILGEY